LTNDLTCAPVKGIHPKFIDYFLEVPTDINNGHQPPIYLGRSTLDVSNTPAKDVLTGSVSYLHYPFLFESKGGLLNAVLSER
jgi:hypothetical protein